MKGVVHVLQLYMNEKQRWLGLGVDQFSLITLPV